MTFHITAFRANTDEVHFDGTMSECLAWIQAVDWNDITNLQMVPS